MTRLVKEKTMDVRMSGFRFISFTLRVSCVERWSSFLLFMKAKVTACQQMLKNMDAATPYVNDAVYV
jgi:hypothetical protein